MKKLKAAAGGEPQRMGFGVPRPRDKTPAMVLLARLEDTVREEVLLAVQNRADALLVSSDLLRREGGGLAFVRERQELLWGIWFKEVTVEPSALKEIGFDFTIVPLQGTPSSFLQQEGLGCIVNIEPSLPDSLLRTLDQLPLDAITLSYPLGEDKLTIEALMAYQRVGNFVRKPLLIRVSKGASPDSLALLQDVGVEGVIVEESVEALGERLKVFRQAIDALPPSKRLRGRTDVFLPTLPSVKSPPPEEEEEEEEVE